MPVLNQIGWLFNLDNPEYAYNLNNILESKSKPNKPNPTIQYPFDKPDDLIDLHIEKLTKNYKTLSPASIKMIQLEYFEQKIAEALAYNMKDLTFIHGRGNQILSQEMHNYLSNHRDVKSYEKDMWNAGITKVEFKQTIKY